MTEEAQKAFAILMEGMEKISTRQCGPMFAVPDYAKAILKNVKVLLTGGDRITLETDATKVLKSYITTKHFVEKFVHNEKDVTLGVLSEYPDGQNYNRALYELKIPDKNVTSDMLDWLDGEKFTGYTSNSEGLFLYFEIIQVTGTETAYLVKQDKKS